jgi:GT2 family glycosyltransferase
VGLIQQTTKINYELIIVDNGSTELGMIEYLEWLENNQLSKKYKLLDLNGKITVIQNHHNLGVAKAWNIGIKEAKGDFIAVLNNDILIGNNCLERLIMILEKNPDVWCISPAFTHLVMPANWHELELHQRFTPEKIVKGGAGFLYIFRKEIIDKLEAPKEGYFIDEQFGMLWYEDTDLWMRLEKAGHPAMSVSNILIHHFESKTIALVPDAKKYMAENRTKFNEKYGIK